MSEISQNPVLGEPSLATALRLLEADASLDPSKKSQWACAIRQLGKWTGRPLECMPARVTALRQIVSRLNAARIGVSQKTLANSKSNLRAALNHLAGQGLTTARGVELSPEWSALMDRISDLGPRSRLYALFRYVSARGLAPSDIDDRILDEFLEYRRQTTFSNVTLAVRRGVGRAWNACVDNIEGFPSRKLTLQAPKPNSRGPDWEVFPQSFRDEIEIYLASLKKPHRSISGRRWKACKASTIRTRRREIVAAARRLVQLGVSVESLTGLRELLIPTNARALLDGYWAESGDTPRKYVIELAWKLCSIGRQTGCLSEEELAELDDMRAVLEEHREHGLIEKNQGVVRAVLSGSIWSKVIALPDRLMADARKRRKTSPVKAATLAQVAVAIRILTYAPIRSENLVDIMIGEHLIRPDGLDGPYWLTFSCREVKNQADLTFPFTGEVSAFIDEYIRDFRPVLLRGSNAAWLFPGGKGNGKHKLPTTLSDQVTKRIDKELGFRITAHQFRHAAGAIILKNQPGNYELVRRVLGHRNIQTTVNFYVGLETLESSKQFGQMIAEHGARDTKGK